MTHPVLTGHLLIAGAAIKGGGVAFYAHNPATGVALETAYFSADLAQVDGAATRAWQCFDAYRATGLNERAVFLEAVAEEIVTLGAGLISLASQETGLATPALEGELGRTVQQIRNFAGVVREGLWQGVRHDAALPDRQPTPRPDLRQRQIPLGPVAVFGSSNFPLAFSVAGGDTAAALAAGCPVVVKAHPAHPGTSELVGHAIARAITRCAMPAGVFSLLHDAGHAVGSALVTHPRIKAVGFTGSRSGGMALMALANARPEPIPVFAEMSSINPLFLLPHALTQRGDALAAGLVSSLTLRAGQLCTNPGLWLAIDGPALAAFMAVVSDKLATIPAATMLTAGIAETYAHGVARLSGLAGVQQQAEGLSSAGSPNRCQATLFVTDAKTFLANPALHEEIFGAAAVLVRCPDGDTLKDVAENLEGQLTATLLLDPEDMALARTLLPTLERRAGRIVVNGFPTGVELGTAMVHGGPFPATSDGGRSTSVGTLAIARFLRPVCYQGFPSGLLPLAIQ